MFLESHSMEKCAQSMRPLVEEEVTRFVVRNGCGMYKSWFVGDDAPGGCSVTSRSGAYGFI